MVVGGGADDPAHARGIQPETQCREKHDRDDQNQDRQYAEAHAEKIEAPETHVADIDRLAVGSEPGDHAVPEDDGEAEGQQNLRDLVMTEHPVDQHPLQEDADPERDQRHRNDDENGVQRRPWIEIEADERRRDDEIALGDVDDAHDAEGKAQSKPDQRIEAAEKNAVGDGFQPDHACCSVPK